MSTQTISFRLDSQSVKVLEERAKRAGLSASGFAREAVLARLDASGPDVESIVEEGSQKVLADLAKVRQDLAIATQAILIVAGRKEPYPSELAKKWVSENLGLA